MELHPELDMTDFTPDQMLRVMEWAARADKLARMDELIRLGQAGREQSIHSVAGVQSYVMGRLVTLLLEFAGKPAEEN